MHTEEEYEGASLGLTREEALQQIKEQRQKRKFYLDRLPAALVLCLPWRIKTRQNPRKGNCV